MVNAAETWREVGDRVFVRRHHHADLNIGLVVGDGACLVIDTRMSHRQGRELAAAVRKITPNPWTVVNTHGHFDHCFGNTVFLPAEIWGHERCVDMLKAHGEIKRAYFRMVAARSGQDGYAADLDEVVISPPARTFTIEASLDVGGRTVRLRHLGRGHTDNDIVVEVPDAAVVFAGDLVEEGAAPVFGDSFPLDWPSTVDSIVPLVRGAVVPGHGAVVDRDFVVDQAATLARTAAAAREAYAAGRDVEDAWRAMPLPEEVARQAATRAYRQLHGVPPYDPPEAIRHALGVA
jgi:glyoxylase-like metal-dependent hydrolase (beta-lactamase superfamily II)